LCFCLFKPKYQKASFRTGGGSNQSSSSAANDDGRFGDHRASAARRDIHLHPCEVAPQLSIIQEDRAPDPLDHGHAESSGGGTPKDDRKKKKKQAKHKAKESAPTKDAVADAESSRAMLGNNDGNSAAVPTVESKPTFTIECVEPATSSLASDGANEKSPNAAAAPKECVGGGVGGLLSTAAFKGGLRLNRSSADLMGGDRTQIPVVLRPSTSRRSSRTDLNYGDSHRRTTSVISAANSFGSGLDDDDLIDPLRDVGVAVNITGGYFAWQPNTSEALLSDINFTADAGEFLHFY
jgi:hypothetical protein